MGLAGGIFAALRLRPRLPRLAATAAVLRNRHGGRVARDGFDHLLDLVGAILDWPVPARATNNIKLFQDVGLILVQPHFLDEGALKVDNVKLLGKEVESQ